MSEVSGGTSVHYGGFWRRFLAYLIDDFIVGIMIAIVFCIFVSFMGMSVGDFKNVKASELSVVQIQILSLCGTLEFMLTWLYFALQESGTYSATLGKRLLGMRVTDESGKAISFARASGRYFAKILSTILIIGWIMAAFTRRKQALHDMLAGTVIVVK